MDNQKICIFDIDGVFNYYPQCWIDFVNKELGADFDNLKDLKSELSYRVYKDLKLKYRTSGIKENLEAREHACNILKELKENNYYIIIISARPVNEINSLVMQTTNWLRKNDLQYDFLMFSKAKHLEIIQKFDGVEFVVEDNRNFANQIANEGYKVYLVNNDYNIGEVNENIKRIDNLKEIEICQ